MAFDRLISLSDDGGAVGSRGATDQDALDAASSFVDEHAGGDAELAELFHETWQLAEQVDDPKIARRLFAIANELIAMRNRGLL